ncbi:hypothetical protein Patl1_33270 [Pistacia atlantica]|uniref:Uncharacterized protein n=1 Tax=Pistacia atlantica TaxID=434234 RepID=A0ACC1ARP2_9ROSI|nr:hypothetical protein Patl1_33270 [Pistacia atlantica]
MLAFSKPKTLKIEHFYLSITQTSPTKLTGFLFINSTPFNTNVESNTFIQHKKENKKKKN